MHNRKAPSNSGEHRAPTSALVHQLEATTTLSPTQAEQTWEGLGEKTEIEMEKSIGKGEREECFYMGIWEKARKDSKEMMGECPSSAGTEAAHGTAQQRFHMRAQEWDISNPWPHPVCSGTKKR